jgi:phage gp29-like protein
MLKIIKKITKWTLDKAKKSKKPLSYPVIADMDVTPDDVRKAFADFKNGIPKKMIEFMNEAKTDGKIKAAMGQLRSGVCNLNWNIKSSQSVESSNGFESSEEDKRKSNITSSLLENTDIKKLIKYLVNATLTGYNVIEIEWGFFNNYHQPKKFIEWDERLFIIENGKILYKVDDKKYELIGDNVLLAPFVEEEQPILLPATILYFIKSYILTLWRKRTAMHGQPFRWGEYDHNLDPEDENDAELLDIMMEGLANFGEDAWALFPDKFKVEFKESIHQAGDHQQFISYMDDQISSSILHQNLTSMVKNGSRSAATTHENMLVSRIYDVGGVVEVYLNDLIQTMERLNFNDGHYSRFKFNRPFNKEESKHKLDVAKVAIDNGYNVKKSFFEKNDIEVEKRVDATT